VAIKMTRLPTLIVTDELTRAVTVRHYQGGRESDE
jgi:hypothetical protein